MNSGKHRIHLHALLVILVALAVASGCDSNDTDDGLDTDDPDSLVGSYTLVSMTDKNGELTGSPGSVLQAGQANDITISEGGQTFTITFRLEGSLTLTSDTYTFSVTFTSIFNGQTDTSTDSDTGSWSVSNGTLTLDSDDPEDGAPESLFISVSGDRMTIEDNELRMVFEKR